MPSFRHAIFSLRYARYVTYVNIGTTRFDFDFRVATPQRRCRHDPLDVIFGHCLAVSFDVAPYADGAADMRRARMFCYAMPCHATLCCCYA